MMHCIIYYTVLHTDKTIWIHNSLLQLLFFIVFLYWLSTNPRILPPGSKLNDTNVNSSLTFEQVQFLYTLYVKSWGFKFINEKPRLRFFLDFYSMNMYFSTWIKFLNLWLAIDSMVFLMSSI